MSTKQTTNWISLSDMMTGLMLIFLLIAILTISQVVAQEEKRQKLLTEFDQSKQEIYHELEGVFGSKREEWGIEITRDLVVKFNNPELLFDTDTAILKPDYIMILDEFVPLYLKIVNDKKYEDKIKEIRIEGHTADFTALHPTYINTVQLSQQRANAVLSYIRDSKSFTTLSPKDSEKLTFWFSANGLGNGRTLNSEGKYSYEAGGGVSPLSRRVEFRIVTNSDELIEQIVNN